MSKELMRERPIRHPDVLSETDDSVKEALANSQTITWAASSYRNDQFLTPVHEGQRFGLGRVTQLGGEPSPVEYEVQRITDHGGVEEREVLAKVITGGEELHNDRGSTRLLGRLYSLGEGDYVFFMLDSVASCLREQERMVQLSS
jgi:hypothetical protein